MEAKTEQTNKLKMYWMACVAGIDRNSLVRNHHEWQHTEGPFGIAPHKPINLVNTHYDHGDQETTLKNLAYALHLAICFDLPDMFDGIWDICKTEAELLTSQHFSRHPLIAAIEHGNEHIVKKLWNLEIVDNNSYQMILEAAILKQYEWIVVELAGWGAPAELYFNTTSLKYGEGIKKIVDDAKVLNKTPHEHLEKMSEAFWKAQNENTIE